MAGAGLAMALAWPRVALAHAELTSSDPEAGASLDKPPSTISLTYTDDIAPEFVMVTLSVAGGPPSQLATSVEGPTVIAALPDGRPGQWRVAFRVVSGDGHPITGDVPFTVGRPDSPPPVTPGEAGSAVAVPTRTPPHSSDRDDPHATTPESDKPGLATAAVAGAAVLVAGLWLWRRGRRGE
ncbi:hypothetical protein HJG43_13985 [Kineosporiaceae bacterium SCSIO 59966]|nr:hypothetical protein HJG43_13985 [Kineosporiaceae bacterium SCSIO 59966]